MPLQPFTRNYQDESTDAGFQFTFNVTYATMAIKQTLSQVKPTEKGFWKGVGQVASIGSQLAGRSGGYSLSTRRKRHERAVRGNDTRMAQRTRTSI